MNKRDLNPIHPGEILLEEFMKPMGISQYRLAKELDVTPTRIGEVVRGKRAISADTAIRLGLFFGIEAKFWLNLQAAYDIELAMSEHANESYRIIKPFHNAA